LGPSQLFLLPQTFIDSTTLLFHLDRDQ